MKEAKKRLGKGLDTLLSPTRLQELHRATDASVDDLQTPFARTSVREHIVDLPLENIQNNPHQPRRERRPHPPGRLAAHVVSWIVPRWQSRISGHFPAGLNWLRKPCIPVRWR